jgi:hypothetical protein
MSLTASLSQNPDSPYGEPQPGQTRHFDLDTSGPVPKVKNSSADYGKPYKIEEVEQKPDWTSERLGKTFKQWNLVLTPQDGAGNGVSKGSAPASSTTDERIARAVAFKGAVELLAANGNIPKNVEAVGAVQELTDALLPIVTGESAEEKAPAPTSDDDIPF